MQKKEQISFLAEKIRQADAVLIGGGSGLSSAAGYNHYHRRNNSGHIMHVTYRVCGMHLQDSHTMTCVILWRKKKSLF